MKDSSAPCLTFSSIGLYPKEEGSEDQPLTEFSDMSILSLKAKLMEKEMRACEKGKKAEMERSMN